MSLDLGPLFEMCRFHVGIAHSFNEENNQGSIIGVGKEFKVMTVRRYQDVGLHYHNLYIKFDNNDKKGNLGNQWQSLISSLLF